jgi:DNA-binding MarR family transcriptional regulator
MIAEAHSLAMALRNAYLTMHRKADTYFARFGVTADQLVLLQILADEGAATQQQLVKRASSDPNTVRAMLLLLEGRGFVSRKPHPVDGRARSVSLTKKGRRVCERLDSAREPFLAQMVSVYQPEEVALLLELLGRLPLALGARADSPAGCQPSVIAEGK